MAVMDDIILQQATSSTQGCDEEQTLFLQWFTQNNGWLNPKCRLAKYGKMGSGMLASEVIEEDEVLFTIPRSILLSLRNSLLPLLCTSFDDQHQKASIASSISFLTWQDVNVGWQGLMITMMWENFRGTKEGEKALELIMNQLEEKSISWEPYFNSLPNSFDTPMFWNQNDLEELKGTSISDKIGKEEATETYHNSVRPFIESHKKIFLGNLSEDVNLSTALLNKFYSLEQFHIMGSRILSRSFHVKPKGEEDESDEQEGVQKDEMSFEEEVQDSESESESDDDDENEDEIDDEAVENVSMVPMADILNAAFNRDNAHLFYKTHTLEMRATRKIESGEQIFNTYGEPPSSDLLRRYGYVDLGCPFEIVELPIECLIQARLQLPQSSSKELLMKRIEWACSLGVEEVSPLLFPFPPSTQIPFKPETESVSKKEWREAALQIPEDLLVLARVLCWTEVNFTKSSAKDRLPNPKIDAIEQLENGKEIGVGQLLLKAIEERKKFYTTTLEEDEEIIFPLIQDKPQQDLNLNCRNAIIIRLIEKRILVETEKMLQIVIEAVTLKRKQDSQSDNNSVQNKKSKRS